MTSVTGFKNLQKYSLNLLLFKENSDGFISSRWESDDACELLWREFRGSLSQLNDDDESSLEMAAAATEPRLASLESRAKLLTNDSAVLQQQFGEHCEQEPVRQPHMSFEAEQSWLHCNTFPLTSSRLGCVYLCARRRSNVYLYAYCCYCTAWMKKGKESTSYENKF